MNENEKVPPTRPVIGQPLNDDERLLMGTGTAESVETAGPAGKNIEYAGTIDSTGVSDDALADRRRRAGALFPEIPVDAERQVLGAGLIIGALTFTAFMGWGPIGHWLNGHGSTGKTAAVAAAPKRGSNGSLLIPAIPSVALPKVTVPKVTVPAAPKVTLPKVTTPPLPVVAAETLPAATEPSLRPANAPVTVAPVAATEPTVVDDLAIEPTIAAESTLAAPPEPPATVAAPTTVAPVPTTAPVTTIAPTASGAPVPAAFTVYFADAQPKPLGRERPKIAAIVEALRALPPGTTVHVVGHASATGDPARNLALSTARAQSVVGLLTEGLGADAANLTFLTEAQGDEAPLANAALSRRVTVEFG